jgi:hypothetical protein
VSTTAPSSDLASWLIAETPESSVVLFCPWGPITWAVCEGWSHRRDRAERE